MKKTLLFSGAVAIGIVSFFSVLLSVRNPHPVCAEMIRLRDTPTTHERFEKLDYEAKAFCEVF